MTLIFKKYSHSSLLIVLLDRLQNLKVVKLFIYFKAKALSSLISFSNFHHSVTQAVSPYHFHVHPSLGVTEELTPSRTRASISRRSRNGMRGLIISEEGENEHSIQKGCCANQRFVEMITFLQAAFSPQHVLLINSLIFVPSLPRRYLLLAWACRWRNSTKVQRSSVTCPRSQWEMLLGVGSEPRRLVSQAPVLTETPLPPHPLA